MISHSIKELKNAHPGADIWIIASGSSLDYVDPSFFRNKITMGINRVVSKYRCDYVVVKDALGLPLILPYLGQGKLILSKHDSGEPSHPLNITEAEHWLFEHGDNMRTVDESHFVEDQLVVTRSTITSGIHLAAYMGAANIILCGHDCGSIDGNLNFKGYYTEIKPVQQTANGYGSFVSRLETTTADVARVVRQRYGVNIHSLNPFLSFQMEGHSFSTIRPPGVPYRVGMISRARIFLGRVRRKYRP